MSEFIILRYRLNLIVEELLRTKTASCTKLSSILCLSLINVKWKFILVRQIYLNHEIETHDLIQGEF